MAASASKSLTRKAGPLPVYGWLVAAVVGYFVYSHFKNTTTAAGATASPNSIDTGTSGSGLATTSAPASGAGSSADNLNADLLASLFGSSVDINSNLVNGLMNANNSIAGLGSEALGQAGQAEQAIINSYTPTSGTVTIYYPTGSGSAYPVTNGSSMASTVDPGFNATSIRSGAQAGKVGSGATKGLQ